MRPIVRPGLRILRRDVHTLQLGLDWPGRACLPDSPALQAVLASIDGFRDVGGVVLAAASSGASPTACAEALDQLVDTGAVVDQSATRRPECDESSWATLWLLAGPTATAGELLRRRQACQVLVAGKDPVADVVRDLLPRAHVSTTESRSEACIVVMTGSAEPDRVRSDEVMHHGATHVWAYVRDLVGVIGPFVVPGRSACLRCADAARSDVDPAWQTTVAAAGQPATPSGDAVLATLVGATVAQDVVGWASGFRPQTLDAVVEIPYGVGSVERHSQPPHPQCGCGWPAWQDTMGA